MGDGKSIKVRKRRRDTVRPSERELPGPPAPPREAALHTGGKPSGPDLRRELLLVALKGSEFLSS